MKKNELEMAIGILQRVSGYYESLFGDDGESKPFYFKRDNSKSRSKTATAQEIRFARRLLLEVEKEL